MRIVPNIVRSLLILACVFASPACRAQILLDKPDTVVRYGDITSSHYRVGVSMTAKRGAVRDVLATVAVPLACPEQEVTLIEEDITETVGSHGYRELAGGGAKQMVVRVPKLPNRSEAHAILTFEVRTRTILPPTDEETARLVIPQKPSRELKRYLGKSPYIETNHSKLKRLAREIFDKLENPDESASADGDTATVAESSAGKDTPSGGGDASARGAITDWQRVEAIYDYVFDTIEYQEQDDKSALATLKDGHGDCQNISALFVALCRTCDIPARIVWVHEHNYPEFCLEDEKGEPHWFPCESSGTRAFGEMPLARVIMQKGDNFKVPERRKALRYASDYMIGLPAQPGGGPPSHKFIRELL